MRRRFTISSLAAVMVLGTVTLPASAQDPGTVEVTILHDTHVHGKYEQGVRTSDGTVPVDIARYFALVQERKDALGGSALFMANGDDIGPSVYSGLFEPHGIHMIDALNEAPLDVNTFGNHEFDYGPDNLLEIIEAAEFPYVTANVRDVDTGEVFGADLGVEEYLIFEVNGVNVGITGLAPENMATITSMGEDTEQIPAEDALDLVVPQMEAAGADVIVVSSHLCGTDAKRLADEYDNHQVDIYAGDHCAVYEEDLYVGETGAVVSLLADEYQFLGELTLTLENGELVDVERTVYTMADEVLPLTVTLECPAGSGSGFPDVPASSVHASNTRCGNDLGLLLGQRDGRFDPDGSLTRGQAATVIDRIANAIGAPIDGERRQFSDVPTSGYVHADAIARLAGAGVIAGFTDGTFRPEREVTRGQLATLLVRYIESSTGEELELGASFPDVQNGTEIDTMLRKARAAGIFRGTDSGEAQPQRTIRRDQAASLFVRSLDELPFEVDQITPLAGIQAVVDSYNAQLDEQLNVVIGDREVAWDTRTTVIRANESAAGNFFTDVMRTAFGGSDIAVTNSGGIRGNQVYEVGDITRRDIAEIFPFGNRLVQAEISGARLREALERSVESVPDPDGGFLQVSGMSFTYNSSLPAGSRVIDVEIGGVPLDPTANYTMATNDFTLGGGDDYPMFRDHTTTLVDSNAGPVLDSFIMEWLENPANDSTVDTGIEGRIVDLAS